MARAVAAFTGGVFNLKQVAVRADGRVFHRYQERDPQYGYKWRMWAPTGETWGAQAIEATQEVRSGSDTLRRASPQSAYVNARSLFDAKGRIRLQLPPI